MPPRSAAQPSNPFASLLAPTSGTVAIHTGAETKAYQVPRELIEIARARASAGPSGALTPIAPRPDQGIEAAVLAYAATVSASTLREQPMLAESVEPPVRSELSVDEPLLEVTSAPAADAGLDGVEVLHGSGVATSLDAAQPLELQRRSRRSDALLDVKDAEPDEPPSSRAWLYYAAGLSLVGAATLALLS